jgi:kynurenine formamidase
LTPIRHQQYANRTTFKTGQIGQDVVDHRSNWGRWTDADQLGALNLITPERVLSAAGLVREGRVLSLAHTIRHDIPHHPDRQGPMHVLTVDGGDYAAGASLKGDSRVADDYLAMPLATGTHLDGLAHAWAGDSLYNGHPSTSVRSRGAKFCGIENVYGIFTRGVIADVAGYRGEDWLPASHCITADELAGSLKETEPGPGDALLIRTGWLNPENINARGMRDAQQHQPGIGLGAVDWIADRDVALVGGDTLGIEVIPPEDSTRSMPVHIALLRDLGTYMMEMLRLDELAASGRQEFLLVVAPMRIRGAINSPVNPLAVF